MLTVTAGQLAGPLILKSIIDHSIPHGDEKDLLFKAGGYLAVILAIGVVGYIQNISISRLGLNIVTRIKQELFDHLLTLPVRWFDQHPVGELISRVESDTEKVREFASRTGIALFSNILFLAGMMVVCFVMDPGITIKIALALPVLGGFVLFFFDKLRVRYEKSRSWAAAISSVVTEFLQGAELIQSFGRNGWAEKKLDQAAKAKRDNDVKSFMLERVAMSALGFCMGPAFIFLVIRALAPRIIEGTVSIGTLLVFIDYGRRLFEPLMEIAENIRSIQQARVSLDRIGKLFEETGEVENSQSLPLPPPVRHGIEFRNVWFKYQDEWVLKDVSFFIEAGFMTALVGASGSGKSTTISLLCRFYKPDKGEILIDGNPIEGYDLAAWRKCLGLVLQESYMFPGSILENLRVYDESISVETVLRAADMVQARDCIEAQSAGLGTELKERGSNLSSGERQLFSFTRALSLDPPIIVLDEATSSIDMQTENRIREALASMLSDRTSIVVAHRLSSILNAKKILVFDQGRIIAQGKHEELRLKCPLYERFVCLQFPDSKNVEKGKNP